jgi:hypothetical protein
MVLDVLYFPSLHIGCKCCLSCRAIESKQSVKSMRKRFEILLFFVSSLNAISVIKFEKSSVEKDARAKLVGR